MQNETFSDADLAFELSEITRAANRANTTIYTIDPRGLVAGQDIDEPVDPQEWNEHLRKTQDTMRILAEDTGGIAVVTGSAGRGGADAPGNGRGVGTAPAVAQPVAAGVTPDAAALAAARARSARRRHFLIQTARYLIVLVALVFFLFPIGWVISTAFKLPGEYLTRPPVWIPADPTTIHFRNVMESKGEVALRNSVIIAGSATFTTVTSRTIISMPTHSTISATQRERSSCAGGGVLSMGALCVLTVSASSGSVMAETARGAETHRGPARVCGRRGQG